MVKEVFKQIPEFEQYEASIEGRIRRKPTTDALGRRLKYRYLIPLTLYGRPHVKLVKDKKIHVVPVAHAICSTFCATYSKKMYQIEYLNKDPFDTRYRNLLMVPTIVSNFNRKMEKILQSQGEDN